VSTIVRQLDDLISLVGGAAGICLSQEGDLLSQWRVYSENGSGVSIGFDQTCFGVTGSPLPPLKQIIYDWTAQKQLIEKELDYIIELVRKGAGQPVTLLMLGDDNKRKEDRAALYQKLSWAVFYLLPHLFELKNPAFQEEKEWRAIKIITPADAATEGGFWVLNEMDFHALPDRIVPHKEILLDTNLGRPVICDVVLGPRNVTPPPIVEAALERQEWKGVRVRKSKVSYR
jgi:hypothetical protein